MRSWWQPASEAYTVKPSGDAATPPGDAKAKRALVPKPGAQLSSARGLPTGVAVDATLKTSLDGVWAAGDCAEVTLDTGARVLEPIWYAAKRQGAGTKRTRLFVALVHTPDVVAQPLMARVPSRFSRPMRAVVAAAKE